MNYLTKKDHSEGLSVSLKRIHTSNVAFLDPNWAIFPERDQ